MNRSCIFALNQKQREIFGDSKATSSRSRYKYTRTWSRGCGIEVSSCVMWILDIVAWYSTTVSDQQHGCPVSCNESLRNPFGRVWTLSSVHSSFGRPVVPTEMTPLQLRKRLAVPTDMTPLQLRKCLATFSVFTTKLLLCSAVEGNTVIPMQCSNLVRVQCPIHITTFTQHSKFTFNYDSGKTWSDKIVKISITYRMRYSMWLFSNTLEHAAGKIQWLVTERAPPLVWAYTLFNTVIQVIQSYLSYSSGWQIYTFAFGNRSCCDCARPSLHTVSALACANPYAASRRLNMVIPSTITRYTYYHARTSTMHAGSHHVDPVALGDF